MENELLKERIVDVLKKSALASFATINEQGCPWIRYMVIQSDDDLNCYAATFKSSRKVKHIENNNNVHLIVGGDPNNFNLPYLNIKAEAQVLSDLESKKNWWHDGLKKFFPGPEDENYAVIKIKPQVIEYMKSGVENPEVYVVKQS